MSQYIGARYVPKFMGTYDNTQAYENMVVVDNGMGTSYISKVPVPAGTPLTNTNYWALYGASSGAIVNLQNQIGDLNSLSTTNKNSLVDAINEVDGNVDALTNEVRGVNDITVLVSDSYGTITSGQTMTWEDEYQAFSGLDNAHCIKLAAAGFGFAINNGTFESLITPYATPASISDSVDPLKVKKIIVCGGFNERNIAMNTVQSAIASFMTYAFSRYPNAKVYIGFIGWSFNVNFLQGFAGDKGMTAYTRCAAFGAQYLNGVENVMKNKALFQKESPSPGVTETYNYIHPNDAGAINLGLHIYQAVLNGSTTVETESLTASYLPVDANTTFTGSFTQQIKDGRCKVQFGGLQFGNASGFPSSFSEGAYLIKLLIDNPATAANFLATASAKKHPVTVRIAASSGYYATAYVSIGYLHFHYGNVYLVLEALPSADPINDIIIYPNSFVVDTFC